MRSRFHVAGCLTAMAAVLATFGGCSSSATKTSEPSASRAASPGSGPTGVEQGADPASGVASGADGPAGQPEGEGQAKHRNRLADETSPYLLLHAHNPVDWYPWGEEAFEKARRENKLIFLSVGYSSCHWCHVMERESFMDDEIAALLNEHFVCIKVDREERPDVDAIYMRAVQIISGGGGWPMSVFLTPDSRPFFGGTYFPARDGDRGSRIGFLTLLGRIHEFWTKDAEAIRGDAERLTTLIQAEFDQKAISSETPVDAALVDRVAESLAEQFDPEYGGFGYSPVDPRRPKFPEPSNLMYLVNRLQHAELDDDQRQQALTQLTRSLDGMMTGGIRDHLGGGFHRYSVDRFWRIPHFEKMLYDNGQLASVYTEAYLLTGNEEYRFVVEEMLEFIRREMTDEGGGFYSALDAESDGEEGKFYRWEKAEIESALDAAEYSLFAGTYGIDGPPNFEIQYYAPQLAQPLARVAAESGTDFDALRRQLEPIRAKLLAVRAERARPLTDTKILTSWNGLMIRGLADAGRGLDRPDYVEMAERAAEFVLAHLRGDDGRLWRTYGQGQAKLDAYLVDYAFLVDGLLALHRATNDEKWLAAADALTQTQLELFWDEAHGGFFFTATNHESLLARIKDPFDGAEPAGNSVAANNLVLLGKALDRPEYLDRARRTIQSVGEILSKHPSAAPRMAVALAELEK